MRSKSSFRREPARSKRAPLLSVALIGYGNWGTALASALLGAGVPLREIVVRQMRRAGETVAPDADRTLLANARLDADVFWICTPDAAIASAAKQLADALHHRSRTGPPIVFHSSGALASTELAVLHTFGASVASVHPLMTFPKRTASQSAKNSLAGVSFAIEGDARASRVARKLVRALGAEPFTLSAATKSLYHAFGAFASPLLVALLTAAVETGVAAGFTPAEARRRMRPIVERTILNFFTEGSAESFSGPIARGDTATVARHLNALPSHTGLRAIYKELARYALGTLPTRNDDQIRRLLDRASGKYGE